MLESIKKCRKIIGNCWKMSEYAGNSWKMSENVKVAFERGPYNVVETSMKICYWCLLQFFLYSTTSQLRQDSSPSKMTFKEVKYETKPKQKNY